jgi:cytochrome c1
MPSLRPQRIVTLVVVFVIAAAGCRTQPRVADNQTPVERGRALAQHNGCGSCHAISGVAHAGGSIGPPLTGLAARSYIAGVLPNTAANLAAWIRSPQSIKPGVTMPDVGLSPRESADIAAFLYTRY